MPRKWFEEKAETPNPEIQKPVSKAYDKSFSEIFGEGTPPGVGNTMPLTRQRTAKEAPDVQKQVNYREGFDRIWSDDNDEV